MGAGNFDQDENISLHLARILDRLSLEPLPAERANPQAPDGRLLHPRQKVARHIHRRQRKLLYRLSAFRRQRHGPGKENSVSLHPSAVCSSASGNADLLGPDDSRRRRVRYGRTGQSGTAVGVEWNQKHLGSCHGLGERKYRELDIVLEVTQGLGLREVSRIVVRTRDLDQPVRDEEVLRDSDGDMIMLDAQDCPDA
jgi:hypothetical protein